MEKPLITSYYCRPLDSNAGFAQLDPCYLGRHLPDFATWLLKKIYEKADNCFGVTLSFKISRGRILLEIKAPESLYETFRGDPAYYERMD